MVGTIHSGFFSTHQRNASAASPKRPASNKALPRLKRASSFVGFSVNMAVYLPIKSSAMPGHPPFFLRLGCGRLLLGLLGTTLLTGGFFAFCLSSNGFLSALHPLEQCHISGITHSRT